MLYHSVVLLHGLRSILWHALSDNDVTTIQLASANTSWDGNIELSLEASWAPSLYLQFWYIRYCQSDDTLGSEIEEQYDYDPDSDRIFMKNDPDSDSEWVIVPFTWLIATSSTRKPHVQYMKYFWIQSFKNVIFSIW